MSVFFQASFHHIVILSYSVDPRLLQSLVPPGLELDLWKQRGLCSFVGLLQTDLRVVSMRLPFPRRLEQVNLRFYVKRTLSGGGVRRGVVFIRELVPSASVAMAARLLYGEPYRSAALDCRASSHNQVEYSFEKAGVTGAMGVVPRGDWQLPDPHGIEHFVLERYWGYNRRGRRTSEFHIEHPPWQMRPCGTSWLKGDTAKLFEHPLGDLPTEPGSALIARGSPVALHWPRKIATGTTR